MTEHPSDPSAAFTEFDVALQQGLHASRVDDVETALAAWGQAATIDPTSPLPHLLIGAELAQAGQPTEAEDAYARAVALAPGFEAARFQLGLLQFTAGRLALAHVSWGPLFQADLTSPFRLFVDAFAALARDDLAVAASLFKRGMAVNTTNSPLNHDIARVLATLDKHQTVQLTSASAATPENDVHVLLAAYRQQGLSH